MDTGNGARTAHLDTSNGGPAPGWSPWRWAGVLVAVLVHGLVMVVAAAGVAFDTQGVCREPATPGDLVQARVGLLVTVALSAGPWVIAAVWSRRHRLPLLVAGAVVSLVPAIFLMKALVASPADWTIDWCLF